jgi:hypothetical protein
VPALQILPKKKKRKKEREGERERERKGGREEKSKKKKEKSYIVLRTQAGTLSVSKEELLLGINTVWGWLVCFLKWCLMALTCSLRLGNSWVPVAHTCNPSTREAEIRRIVVQSQLGQIVHETLS